MSSIADQLEQLASLRDRGMLTEAEFAQQKAVLLGSAAPHEEPVPPTPAAPPTSAAPPAAGGARSGGISGRNLGLGALAAAAVAVVAVATSHSRHSSSTPSYTASSDTSDTSGAASGTGDAGSDSSTDTTAASDDSAPTEESVKATLIAKQMGSPESYRFNSIQISDPQAVTQVEQARFAAPAGETWWLVKADYAWLTSGTDWNNPAAYIHDVVHNYAMFKNQFGQWQMESDTQPDEKDELRGGYTS